jgi:hypothetical protein
MQDPLDRYKDQVFYREALRLREEQRQRLGIVGRQGDRPANVVSFAEFRERRMQQSPVDKPTKPVV